MRMKQVMIVLLSGVLFAATPSVNASMLLLMMKYPPSNHHSRELKPNTFAMYQSGLFNLVLSARSNFENATLDPNNEAQINALKAFAQNYQGRQREYKTIAIDMLVIAGSTGMQDTLARYFENGNVLSADDLLKADKIRHEYQQIKSKLDVENVGENCSVQGVSESKYKHDRLAIGDTGSAGFLKTLLVEQKHQKSDQDDDLMILQIPDLALVVAHSKRQKSNQGDSMQPLDGGAIVVPSSWYKLHRSVNMANRLKKTLLRKISLEESTYLDMAHLLYNAKQVSASTGDSHSKLMKSFSSIIKRNDNLCLYSK